MRFITTLLLAIAAAMFASACSRTRYRMAADRDSYGIIQEKANCIEKPIDPTFTYVPIHDLVFMIRPIPIARRFPFHAQN